jgi:4-amino-4-deoxy-L-arabinose transferase-like glycosyltransferase
VRRLLAELRDPLPIGPDGRPEASIAETRLAFGVALAASLFFALAAAWELFGPLLAGHYASSASMGIIAENMRRHGIAGPVWEYTSAPPTPAQYYCHHPWGIFWTTTGFFALFGRHDFVCRLPAVLLSAATPPLLHALGRAMYRPLAGATAALAFAVLPITLAFANMNALEVPVTAWSLVALLGFVRLTQTGKRRFLALSLVGATLALNADWPAFVLVGELLAFALLRGFFLPTRVFGPLPFRRYALFWALAASISVATGVLYLGLFQAAGKLHDLFGSYDMRSSGNQLSLAKVLEGRRYWIELAFTPVAIALGKAGAVVLVARVVLLRREHDVLPLAVLGMATFQYLVFKQGADIHVFWPHYYATYFALAMAALVATTTPAILRLTRRFSPRRGLALAAAVAFLPLAPIARDGLPALVYARETGGRFEEKGNLIASDGDKTAFLHWLAPQLPRTGIVDLHGGMRATWAQVWALGGVVVSSERAVPKGPVKDARDTFLADRRYLKPSEQEELAREFAVTAVGPYWWVDRRRPGAPPTTYQFVAEEPSLLTWYFVSGTEPVRTIAPDPWGTWELRQQLGFPADPPRDDPTTLDELRIAHNAALVSGDSARQNALFAQIGSQLASPHATLAGGTELLGTVYHEGAEDRLTVVVRAAGPLPPGTGFSVRAVVTEGAWLSTTMADPTPREVALPFAVAPERWRAGFLYANVIPIRKRPGTEVFSAAFTGSRAPKSPDGRAVELLRLR